MTESWRRESPRHSSTLHAAVPTVVQLCPRLLAANCECLSEQSSCGNCPNCARSRAFRLTSRARGTFALLLHLLQTTLRFGSLWIREKVILPEVRFYFWWSFMQRSLKDEGVCKFCFALSPEFDIILSSRSSDVSIKDKCLVACKLTIKICEKILAALLLSNIKLKPTNLDVKSSLKHFLVSSMQSIYFS